MWYNGLKIDKAKVKKQVRVSKDTKYVFFRHDNARWGAFANAALTDGKIYKIIKFTTGRISIINDRGSLKTYDPSLFYEVSSQDVFSMLDTESLRDTQIDRLFK